MEGNMHYSTSDWRLYFDSFRIPEMMAKICPGYPNIYWKNMVHELGLICTYPASVQEAIPPKSCKRVQGCIDPVNTAGSERSAGKYLLQLLLTAAINALWLGWNMMLLHIICCWIWSGRSLKASERFIHQELETCFYNILNIKERILEICVLDGGMTFYFIFYFSLIVSFLFKNLLLLFKKTR